MRKAIQSDLLQMLTDDFEAQERNKDEIVGLDFDPFLGAQDPCERYKVASISRKNQSYWVAIHGIGGCEKHPNADLQAEVVPKGETWEFANFHYLGVYPTDLRTVLAKLRRDRE
jgi:hypothetical protein